MTVREPFPGFVERKLRPLLAELARGRVAPWMYPRARELLGALAKRPAPKKAPILSLVHHDRVTAEADVSAKERRRAVRKVCLKRALGRCEACGTVRGAGLHLDHFWGRAKAPELVENCWMLCPRCDREKTENVPSRLHWLAKFGVHAAKHGYAEQERKVESAVALERAQHPGSEP